MKYPNGSESVLSPGPWSQLVGVKKCPCEDGISRRVWRIRVPDTAWSAPGYVTVRGKTVAGFVTCDEQGYRFIASRFSQNAYIIDRPARILKVLGGE